MNDFMTWSNLATFAGCTAGVAVITQFIKNAGVLKKVPTQWISYAIAVILMFGATYFTGALTGPAAALIPFNAVVVSFASNGAYSAISRATGLDVANAEADGNGNLKITDGNGKTIDTVSAGGGCNPDSKQCADADKPAETTPETSETVSK